MSAIININDPVYFLEQYETALKSVLPFVNTIEKSKYSNLYIDMGTGVLIGLTGQITGKLILHGEQSLFHSIGELMFGMSLEGAYLESFIGELGNMVAGAFSTNVAQVGIVTDITSPTILGGQTKISGFKSAANINVIVGNEEKLHLFLLFD